MLTVSKIHLRMSPPRLNIPRLSPKSDLVGGDSPAVKFLIFLTCRPTGLTFGGSRSLLVVCVLGVGVDF